MDHSDQRGGTLTLELFTVMLCIPKFGFQAKNHVVAFPAFKLQLHVQFLTPNCNAVQKIIALLSHLQISVCSMSCAVNTTASEKLQKIESSDYSINFSIGKFCWHTM